MAPVESVTVPLMLPVKASCAQAPPQTKPKNAARTAPQSNRLHRFISLPPRKLSCEIADHCCDLRKQFPIINTQRLRAVDGFLQEQSGHSASQNTGYKPNLQDRK